MRLVPLVVGMFILALVHYQYLAHSGVALSWDEAHYTGGSLGIARAIRTGSLVTMWQAFTHALGFKAPLICVPTALGMFLTNDPVFGAQLSLIFILLGIAALSYHLFRNVFEPLAATTATLLLCASPLMTGLTHRIYVEGLLLLLVLAYLDLLIRSRLARYWHVVACGFIGGLGILCKITFAPLVVLPSLYLAYQTFREKKHEYGTGKALQIVGPRYVLLAVVTTLVASSWYSVNWRAAMDHAVHFAMNSAVCDYPFWGSFLVTISDASQFWVSVVALAGLVPLAIAIVTRKVKEPESTAWVALLLASASALLLFFAGSNKAVRFLSPGLPGFAAVCVWTIQTYARSKWRNIALITCSAVGLIGAVQSCFNPFPWAEIKFGDLRVIGSHSRLNIPNWGIDNYPLDTADLGLKEAELAIADDWSKTARPGAVASSGPTLNGLTSNYNYLNLLADINQHPVHYLDPAAFTKLDGSGPDYVLVCEGCMKREERYWVWHTEQFADAVQRAESKAIPYHVMYSHGGPDHTTLTVLRKTPLESLAGSPSAISMEAEAFDSSNARIDRADYGLGIGVIVSEKTPTFADYRIKVPTAGSYQLEFRCASAVPRPVQIRINGNPVSEDGCNAVTGGFGPNSQTWQPAGVYSFLAGENQIHLQSPGPFPHIDKLSVAPAKARPAIPRPAQSAPPAASVPSAQPAPPVQPAVPAESPKDPIALVEAEKFSSGNFTVDTVSYGKGIGVVISLAFPAFAQYELSAPAAGEYELRIRYAAGLARPVALTLNGTVVAKSACGAATGGFGPESQKWETVGRFAFRRGKNILRIDRAGPIPHLDKIAVVR